jgi:hypothetical protein
VDQNTSLKKEAGIAERKLLARNERIQNLEALLQDADRRLAAQNQKFEVQLQAVKERLDQARGMFRPEAISVFRAIWCLPQSSTKGRDDFLVIVRANCQTAARRRWQSCCDCRTSAGLRQPTHEATGRGVWVRNFFFS